MTTTTNEAVLAGFQARLDDAEHTSDCAHFVFPEVSTNETAQGVCDVIYAEIVSAYDMGGALVAAGVVSPEQATATVAHVAEHALVIAMAFGIALGRAQM